MNKKLLVSVTRKDLELKTFRSGGPGGQHQNKRDTGVSITHKGSGARGEARDRKSQVQNKRAAFERMVESSEFQTWLKLECGKAMMTEAEREAVKRQIKLAVSRQMAPQNLLVEYMVDNQWQEVQE